MKLINIQPKNTANRTPQEWRSWLNDLTDWQHDLLHNHRPEGGEIYRYPLVQYHGKGFRGMQEGVGLLVKLLPLLEAETDLEISTQKHDLKMLEKPRPYSLKRWQPFNSENYTLWNDTRGLADRIKLLESILVGNVLGFCRAVGFEIPNKQLEVSIIGNLDDLGFQRFSTLNAELYRRTFSVQFEANIALPEGIGLGRGSSKGYGGIALLNEISPKSHPKKEISG